MKKNKLNHTHNTIGKILCGCAGAIIGFIVGGPLLAVPAVLIGVLGGQFLEQQLA